MTLEHRVAEALDVLGAAGTGPIGAAVSGGADSVAMLHVLASLRPVHVLHVDHGLRDESREDARFVSKLASSLGVPCTVLRVSIDVPRGESLEAVAREARYRALEEAADAAGLMWVATAHTLDDQAETVLMRALRGSGTAGLAGIAPVRGRFVRPLLGVERSELRAWLVRRGLAWREDASNEDTRFERNWIRHELLPLIDRRRPGATRSLARLASLARSDERTLDALADDVVERAQVDDAGVLFECFDVVPVAIASRAVRKACWVMGSDPSHLDVFELMAGRRCGGLVAQRISEGLAIVRDPVPVPQPLELTPHTEIVSSQWAVRLRVGSMPAGTSLRSRRPGDRVRTPRGTRKVQDVLVDAKVPRVLRDLVPIVANADGAVAVVGHTVPADASGVVIDVEPYEPTWSRAIWWNRATA